MLELERTDADDVELESALQELALNLRCDAVETDMAAREHRLWSLSCRHIVQFRISDVVVRDGLSE